MGNSNWFCYLFSCFLCLLIYFICMHVLLACVCLHCICFWYLWRPEKFILLLELELETVVTLHLGKGIEPGSCEKAVSVLNCWAIFLTTSSRFSGWQKVLWERRRQNKSFGRITCHLPGNKVVHIIVYWWRRNYSHKYQMYYQFSTGLKYRLKQLSELFLY